MDNYSKHALNSLQKVSMTLMAVLMVFTFVAANLQAILWQSSQWLVSTVLPAVVVQLTNDERADLSEAPLRRNATLDRAARLKAEHMARNGYFAHFAPDGTSPWHWFDEAGYVYAHAGENLAIHFTDSSEVVDAWMKSPKHRENIVNGLYSEIGVGTAKGKFEGFDTVYVVQLFGTPAQAPIAPGVAAAPITTPVVAAVEVTTKIIPVIAQPKPVELAKEVVSEPESAVLAEEDSMIVITDVATTTDQASSTLTLAAVASTTPVAPVAYFEPEDIVVVETAMIATSSGLAVASLSEVVTSDNQNIAAIATKPNTVLQFLYTILGAVVITMLLVSTVIEARRKHYVQVAYGCLLLLGMASLWYVHTLWTAGAVIA